MNRLPRLLVVTDRRISARPLCEQLTRALDGLRAPSSEAGIVFRERDLDPASRLRLASRVAEAAHGVGAPLFIGTSGARDRGVEIAADVGAEGLHLSSWAPIPAKAPAVLGRSCHSEIDLVRAGLEGMDYVTVSPVFDSLSKIGRLGGGSAMLARLTGAGGRRRCPPVFALGGITPNRVAECISAGAFGVAVCGALMMSSDPAGEAKKFAQEIEIASSRGDG